MNARSGNLSAKKRDLRERKTNVKRNAREREREARKYTTRAHPLYARVQVQTHLLFPTTKAFFFVVVVVVESLLCVERERERRDSEDYWKTFFRAFLKKRRFSKHQREISRVQK